MKKQNTLLLAFLMLSMAFVAACQDESSVTNEEIDTRDALVGEWRCEEDASGISYTVTIAKDEATENKLILTNFHGLGADVTIDAQMGFGIVTIDKTTIDGYTIEGDGQIADNNKSIAWEYTIDDGNGPETYLALYTPAGIVVKYHNPENQNKPLS